MRPFVVLLFLVVAIPVRGQTLAEITGRMTDPSGGVMPGVTVTIASGPLTLRAITDEDGRYRLRAPLGPAHLTATLAGFETVTRELALTAPGSTTVDVVMHVGCLDEVLHVDMGLDAALKRARAIAVIDVLDAGPRTELRDGPGCVWGYVQSVRVLDLRKGTLPPSLSIHVGERPLRPGDRYLVFLNRPHEAWAADALYVFAIGDGLVQWHAEGLPGATRSMPVERLLELLTARLEQQK